MLSRAASSRFAIPAFRRADSKPRCGSTWASRNVFWLGGGVAGDDTHGHVDDLCRFVNAKTVVLIKEENRRGRQLPGSGGELGARPRFAP